MPDLIDIKNRATGADSRSLILQFASGQESLQIPFKDLSDGEKCFMVCAMVLAANRAYGPLLCYWDEPDRESVLPPGARVAWLRSEESVAPKVRRRSEVRIGR